MTSALSRPCLPVLLVAAVFAAPAWAQSPFLRPLRFGARDSIALQGASAYLGYTTNAAMSGTGFDPGRPSLGGDFQVGGSATLGWNRAAGPGALAGVYSISYAGALRNSGLNSLNHSLSLGATRRIGPRWSLGLSLAGSASSRSQYMFSPTASGFLASVPGDSGDLAAAVAGGADPAAQSFAGGPVAESPARSLLYGDRVLSASAGLTVSWRATQRLQTYLSAGAARSQNLPSDNDAADNAYLVARSTAANASLGFSYSLTRRTRIAADASGSRNFGPLQNAYSLRSTLSLQTKAGRHWFFDAHAGAAVLRTISSVYRLPSGPQTLAGCRLGYRTRAHTLLLTQERSVSDAGGLLAGPADLTGAAWNWSSPGRSWMAFFAAARQRMRVSGLEIDGWVFQSGVGRALNRRTSIEAVYAFLSNSGRIAGPVRDLSGHQVRLQIAWTPAEGAR